MTFPYNNIKQIFKSESKKTNERLTQLERTTNERFDLEVAFDIVSRRQTEVEVDVNYMKKVMAR